VFSNVVVTNVGQGNPMDGPMDGFSLLEMTTFGLKDQGLVKISKIMMM